MARIRVSISWAAYPFLMLISLLFSAVHLAPPAWANTAGANTPEQDELATLITDLSETDQFDSSLRDEVNRLQALAQSVPGPKLVLPGQLPPPPAVPPEQSGGAVQPQQAIRLSPEGNQAPVTVQPQQAIRLSPEGNQAPVTVQPQQAIRLSPEGNQAPGAVQPQQAIRLSPEGSQAPGAVQPQQAIRLFPEGNQTPDAAQPQQASLKK